MKDSFGKPLKTGMPLPYDLVLSRGRIRFRKGTPVTEEILKLIREGNPVEITIDTPVGKTKSKNEPQSFEPSSFDGKQLKKTYILKNARKVILNLNASDYDPFSEYHENVLDMWSDSLITLDINGILKSVESWISAIGSNRHRFTTAGWHHPVENYVPIHMVNAARFLSELAHELGLKESAIRELTIAALFQDMGEIFIGKDILTRKSNLTSQERKKLLEHPRKSVEYLKRTGYLSDSVQRLILRHHERFDGSGYPYNITGKVLGLDDCLIGLVDMYIALISKRPYRQAYTRRAAVKMILSLRDRNFSAKHAEMFASVMGLFPPGSIVELKGGGFAIVLSSPVNGKWPGLLVNMESDRKQYEKIDLNHLAGDYIVQEIA